MLALVCTLVFAAAAVFAMFTIFVTLQGRKSQITALFAEYRSLQRDREYLVRITSHEAQASRAFAAPQLRRTVRRMIRPAEAPRPASSLRAAA
jgi:hypothetical protein